MSVLKCGSKDVPSGQYLVIWGPNIDDRSVVKERPRIECNEYGVYFLSFSVRDKTTKKNRHLHFANTPVSFMREVKTSQTELYTEPVGILRGFPAAGELEVYHVVRYRESSVTILTKTDDHFLEYTFFHCPIMLELWA